MWGVHPPPGLCNQHCIAARCSACCLLSAAHTRDSHASESTLPCVMLPQIAGNPENHDPHAAGRHGRDQPQGRPHGGLSHLVRRAAHAVHAASCGTVPHCAEPGNAAADALYMRALRTCMHRLLVRRVAAACNGKAGRAWSVMPSSGFSSPHAPILLPCRFAYRSIFSTVNLAMEVRPRTILGLQSCAALCAVRCAVRSSWRCSRCRRLIS